MVHGDDKGLRIPPKIAPIQIVVVPISKTDEDKNKVRDYISPLLKKFDNLKVRYLYDDRDKISPGFKFNEWEMKGVPIRIEVGPRDVDNNMLIYSRRDKSCLKGRFKHITRNPSILSNKDFRNSFF